MRLGLSFNGILAMLASQAPFFLTNLLEHYSGVYEYAVANIDGTSGQMLLIFFNLLTAVFGAEVYDLPIKEIFWFLPSFLSRDYILRDYAIVILIYIGFFYSIILIFYIMKSMKSVKVTFICIFQILQHFICYVILFYYDNRIEFIHNNAGYAYIAVAFIYALVTTKLIVCTMAKMEFSVFHPEYLVFLVYFYFQYNYEPTPEYDFKIKWSFLAVLFTIIFLYFGFVKICIDQIANYLGVYCFSIEKRKQKSQ